MTDNRNTILAVILSGLVLIGWQYFFNIPQMEKQRAAQQAQSELAQADGRQRGRRRHAAAAPPAGTAPPATRPRQQPAAAARVSPRGRDRRNAADQDRNPAHLGSISLKGARIDDVSLVQFRETVDPASPAIVLFSPSGTAEPYYAEFGWVPAAAPP